MAARSDHRPARHRFSLAPSRLLGSLGIRLMSPLARGTPQDQWRGPRAYSPNEPREFLMGRATDPRRAAETWIRCLASHSIPLHAATGLSATQRWRTFLRNQAFAIGAIGFGEAGGLSDVVREWIMRVVRCATKVRDGIPCRPIEPSSTLHPLRPCRSSNRADRRFTQRRCVPGSSAAHPSKRHPLDLASRRLSPYRSRASPRRKLPGIRHTIIRYRAQSQADHNSFTAIALCVCYERSETLQKSAPKSKDLQKPVASWRSPCDSATADKVMRSDPRPSRKKVIARLPTAYG